MTFSRRALLGAIAAVLAVATPTVHAAGSARGLLSSELPAGVTLAKASINQTAGAVKSAIAKDPSLATEILKVAIVSKEPKQGRGKLSCEDVSKLTRAAIASDNADASKLVDVASALHPECADALGNLLTNTAATDSTGGLFGPAEDYNFGAGFGPGFPGSPGFVGSAPSGAIALPPVPTPVTNVLNN